MSCCDNGLPFPRGQTYGDGTLTLTSSIGEHLLGRVYKTTDSSGRDLWLRVVRADSALTNVGGKTVSYTSGKVGKNVDALTNAAGEIASIVDDEYATTYDISQYDLFYVVEEGDVDAAADSTVNAAGQAVMAEGSGDDVIVATAGSFVIGVSNEAVADGISSIHVGGNLKPSDAAS